MTGSELNRRSIPILELARHAVKFLYEICTSAQHVPTLTCSAIRLQIAVLTGTDYKQGAPLL